MRTITITTTITTVITIEKETEYKKTKFREMTVDEIGKWARQNYENYAEFVKSPESLQNVILQGLQQRKNLNALQLLDFFFLMKFGRKRKVEHSRGKWTVEGLRSFERTGKPGQGRKLI